MRKVFSLNITRIILSILFSLIISNIAFFGCKVFLSELQQEEKLSEENNKTIFDFFDNTIFFGVQLVESAEKNSLAAKNDIGKSPIKENKPDEILELTLDMQCAIKHSKDLNYYNSENGCVKEVKDKLSGKIVTESQMDTKKDEINKNNGIKKSIKGSLLIKSIEYLLITTLGMQIFLAIYTALLNFSILEKSVRVAKFDQYIFHISDFCINTPPILGVMANLASFAILVTKSSKSSGNIMDYFGVYFFDAVITTLIGAIFYIINLGLKIFIQPRIDPPIEPRIENKI